MNSWNTNVLFDSISPLVSHPWLCIWLWYIYIWVFDPAVLSHVWFPQTFHAFGCLQLGGDHNTRGALIISYRVTTTHSDIKSFLVPCCKASLAQSSEHSYLGIGEIKHFDLYVCDYAQHDSESSAHASKPHEYYSHLQSIWTWSGVPLGSHSGACGAIE